jgi:hypothetical protein
VGIDDAAAQSATRFDGTLAELVFQAGNTTGSAGAIFRDAFPPARFADTNALPVDPCLIATAPIWIDDTPDDCPHNVLELRLAPGSSRVRPGESGLPGNLAARSLPAGARTAVVSPPSMARGSPTCVRVSANVQPTAARRARRPMTWLFAIPSKPA